MHPRAHVARIDENGRHSLVEELGGQRASEQLERGFARSVRAPAGIRAVRRIAGDVDDEPAAGGKQREGELNECDRRAGIDREHATKALDVEGHQRTNSAEL
jgi:hypothetical protein